LTEYQILTDDELLHLAEERNQLTDNARVSLGAEISRRRLSPSDIDSYKLRRATPQLFPAVVWARSSSGKPSPRPERWLGMVVPSDAVALERHPRNWEQILLTWAKVASLLLAFRLAFFLLMRHPEWLKHLG
jgi:hypothetical protein